MERIPCRRKQFLHVLTARCARNHRSDRECGTRRSLCRLFPGRSDWTRCRILDWHFAVLVYLGLPYFRLGARLSADGPDHVPPTMSCTGRICPTVGFVSSHPGPVLLYMLFFMLLAVAMVMISCALTCATCCIAAIPYIGTVILLPIPVTLGAFSLLFLRQFGPNYDVWAGFIPPEFLPMLMPPPASSGTEAP